MVAGRLGASLRGRAARGAVLDGVGRSGRRRAATVRRAVQHRLLRAGRGGAAAHAPTTSATPAGTTPPGDLYTTLEKAATAEKKTIMKSRSVCSVVSMEVEASKKGSRHV